MDQDLNNLNLFEGDHDSFHFPPPTQDRSIRRSSVELKNIQQLISPANMSQANRIFLLPSPSPFKHNVGYFYEEQQSDQHENRDGSAEPRANKISRVVNFDQSPKFKKNHHFHATTASTHRTINRNLQFKPPTLSIKDDRKNSKGLRNLSESVFRIVKELHVTTYKQVADQLVRMLNAGQFGPLEQENSKAKDEQNIKRRVYDALNVLISADVLKKNGKHVMSQQDSMSQKCKSNRNGKKQDKDNLTDQIKRKQNLIREKKQRIEELKHKKQILNAIIKRNKKKKLSDKEKLTFPLIGATYKFVIPKLLRNQTNTRIHLPIGNLTEIIGDMDLLVKAGIDVVSQNIEEIMEDVNLDDVDYDHSSKKKPKVQSAAGQVRTKTSRILYSL